MRSGGLVPVRVNSCQSDADENEEWWTSKRSVDYTHSPMLGSRDQYAPGTSSPLEVSSPLQANSRCDQ